MYFDYCTGMTMQQVADYWDFTPSQVSRNFQKLGVPVRRQNRPRRTHTECGPAATTDMYTDYCDGLTARQVADKWGCTATTIIRRFKEANLPMRHPAHERNEERTRQASVAIRPTVIAVLPDAPPHWRDTLQLRLDHPHASLAELGAMHNPPVTKDVVSSILRRARAKHKPAYKPAMHTKPATDGAIHYRPRQPVS